MLVFLLILPLTFSIINAHAATNTYQLGPYDGKFHTIPYTITGGKLLYMKIDPDFNSIIIEVQADNNGTIKIEFPRTLIDDFANIGEFIVLINGNEYGYEEISATCDNRTLLVKFPAGTQEIELISPYQAEQQQPALPRQYSSIPIHINQETFIVNATSSSKICSWHFSAPERKLEFIITGGERFTVFFPRALLDANFTVLLDGEKVSAQQSTWIVATVTDEVDVIYNSGGDIPRKIEIIGSSAIPEFPVNLMLVTAVGLIGVLIALRMKARIT